MTTERPVHTFTLRVYYEDTDFSGVVYHASYVRFLERGRTEFLRDLGINQADLFGGSAGLPLGFVVARMSLGFLKPARMDDLLRAGDLARLWPPRRGRGHGRGALGRARGADVGRPQAPARGLRCRMPGHIPLSLA